MDVVLLKSYFVLKTQMLNIVTVCLLIEKILFFFFFTHCTHTSHLIAEGSDPHILNLSKIIFLVSSLILENSSG